MQITGHPKGHPTRRRAQGASRPGGQARRWAQVGSGGAARAGTGPRKAEARRVACRRPRRSKGNWFSARGEVGGTAGVVRSAPGVSLKSTLRWWGTPPCPKARHQRALVRPTGGGRGGLLDLCHLSPETLPSPSPTLCPRPRPPGPAEPTPGHPLGTAPPLWIGVYTRAHPSQGGRPAATCRHLRRRPGEPRARVPAVPAPRAQKGPPAPGEGHPPRCARRSQDEGAAGSRSPPRRPGPKRAGSRGAGAAFRVGDAGRRGGRLVLAGARRRLTAAAPSAGRARRPSPGPRASCEPGKHGRAGPGRAEPPHLPPAGRDHLRAAPPRGLAALTGPARGQPLEAGADSGRG